MDEGPPDSHEAMNNRELKPKLTISSREKRSYEFLMGLVNNNTKFQDDGVDSTRNENFKISSEDVRASELLLEMMVKIAAHPNQWEQVHNLLQKIDNDLLASKKILKQMQNKVDNKIGADNREMPQGDDIEVNKKQTKTEVPLMREEPVNLTKEVLGLPSSENKTNHTDTDEVQRMVVIINGENKLKTKNLTTNALKTNSWPYEGFSRNVDVPFDTKDGTRTTKFPWQMQTKSLKNTYPRNFAYHRVTGNPLYHSSVKNPKAYIAVSVIAPKPMNTPDDDLVLENELRELKPWTHNQNLKNMASIRSRWVIQSDQAKPSYAP